MKQKNVHHSIQMNRLTQIRKPSKKRSWFRPPEALDTLPHHASQSIILAEDDDLLREIYMLHLTSRGFDVRCAADGTEAWRLVREAPFALLITDHEMPGIRGLELVRKMRAESYQHPVILISGVMPWEYSELEDLLTPGAAMEKPFQIDELIRVMCAMVAFRTVPSQIALST